MIFHEYGVLTFIMVMIRIRTGTNLQNGLPLVMTQVPPLRHFKSLQEVGKTGVKCKEVSQRCPVKPGRHKHFDSEFSVLPRRQVPLFRQLQGSFWQRFP